MTNNLIREIAVEMISQPPLLWTVERGMDGRRKLSSQLPLLRVRRIIQDRFLFVLWAFHGAEHRGCFRCFIVAHGPFPDNPPFEDHDPVVLPYGEHGPNFDYVGGKLVPIPELRP